MNENILLTEANYKDKYPPLGLMKISTFHKFNGDNVYYSRDYSKEDRNYYSKIYISTRFSFHWEKTKLLINYYKENFDAEILIGGIHASINPDLYEKTFQIRPIIGSYKGEIEKIKIKIKQDDILNSILPEFEKYGIDILPPDYSLFENQDLPFNEVLANNYLLRATKGCLRKCEFCDVKKISEGYIPKLPLSPIISYIKKNFGEKKDVLFFDDNTLISSEIDAIVNELIICGFEKGAKLNRKNRICDFNQGLDLRLLDEKKLKLLKSICIKPIRFAFDDISIAELFKKKIVSVINTGIRNISVYVLYNYKDTPKDFFERLLISVNFNRIYNSRISSFPMKFIPNNLTNRKYIGINWNKRMIRGVQCILNACHGIVPVKYEYFITAFGKNAEEFEKIIQMPEKYIINRQKNRDEIREWEKDYFNLDSYTRNQVLNIISTQTIYSLPKMENINLAGEKFLNHYLNEKY